MRCILKMLHLLSEIAAPWVKACWEGGEKVRGLEARAQTAEKKCSELEEVNRTSQAEIRSLRHEVAMERAGKHLAAGVSLSLMLFYHVNAFLVGLVLGILYGGSLLRLNVGLEQFVRQGLCLSDSLWQSARLKMRPLLNDLAQFVERTHRGIRDWKWNPLNVSRSFDTGHL